jgi:hypothetical protein
MQQEGIVAQVARRGDVRIARRRRHAGRRARVGEGDILVGLGPDDRAEQVGEEDEEEAHRRDERAVRLPLSARVPAARRQQVQRPVEGVLLLLHRVAAPLAVERLDVAQLLMDVLAHFDRRVAVKQDADLRSTASSDAADLRGELGRMRRAAMPGKLLRPRVGPEQGGRSG